MNRAIALAVSVTFGFFAAAAVAQTKPSPPAAATPAANSSDAVVRAAIQKAVPGAVIDSIKPSLIPGYREVAIGGRIVYVTTDGKYLIQGSLIDLGTRSNLTEASEAVLRRAVLDAVPRDRRIIFAPDHRVHRYRLRLLPQDAYPDRRLHESRHFGRVSVFPACGHRL